MKVLYFFKGEPEMSSRLFSYLSGMVLLLVSVGVNAQDQAADTQGASQREPMIIEVVSPYGFEQTDRLMQQGIKNEGWSVPKVYDWQAIVKLADVDVGPFKMYDICKADYAAQILQYDQLRLISTLMPCATSVYTKQDGKTYVAYMNVNLLAKMFGQQLAVVAQQAGEARDRALSFLKQ
jgi:uncharacterized protein (DUF302 family)